MKRKHVQIAFLMVLAAGLLFTGNVMAHALLARSVPEANADLLQPPATLELWFSEPLEAGFSSVRLLTTNGEEVPLDAQKTDANDPTHLSVSLSPLKPGIYTAAWKSLSRADGHAWFGNFSFTLLNPDGSRPAGSKIVPDADSGSELPNPLQVAARWLALTGSILLMGVALFLSYVAAESIQGNPELEVRLNTLGINLVGLAVLAIVLGSWLQLAAQAAQLGSLALLPRLLFETYSGVLILVRQVLSLGGLWLALWFRPLALQRPVRWILGIFIVCITGLSFLILWAVFQSESLGRTLLFLLLGGMAVLAWRTWRAPRSTSVKGWKGMLLLGGALLLSFSVGSHAAAVAGSFWAVGFDAIHLLATSSWMGGLLLLPLMLEQHRRSAAGADTTVLRPLFRRYGYMAKFSFFLLLSTGLFNSLVQFPSLDGLIYTSYGRLLLIKLLLVLIVWGISLHSSRLFRGRPEPTRMATLLGQFTRQMGTAAQIGLVLMLSIAVLVQTQPPPKPSSQDSPLVYHNLVDAADLRIHLQATLEQAGLNKFYVQLSRVDGLPVGDVLLVRLMFDNQDAQLGQSKTDLNLLEPDVFGAEGAFLNQPGRWKISAYVRRRGLDDTVADIGRLTLPVPVAQDSTVFQNPVSTIPVGGLLAGMLVISGAEIFRWRKTIHQVRPTLFRFLLSFGGILIALGLALGVFVYMISR